MAKRKLIEAAIPLDGINDACKADKDRKTGTIRNLHKWFAPMPSPAWRALLFASLVDEPDDASDRERLWNIIEQLVESGPEPPSEAVLRQAASAIQRSNPGSLPLILDPFCGGGSTIVEALRLGLPAEGTDLNPVAVLITRTLCELIPPLAGTPALNPARGQQLLVGGPFAGFIQDVLHYGAHVRERALKAVGSLLPRSPSGATVFAWLWARTVRCPNPVCGSQTVLSTSWWLSKRPGERAWLEPLPTAPGGPIEFAIRYTGNGPPDPPKLGRGATFRCLACESAIPERHIATEGGAGRITNRLLALACIAGRTRTFELPDEAHQEAVTGLAPDEDLLQFQVNDGGGRERFGFDTYAQLFAPRQARVLDAFAAAVADVPEKVQSDGGGSEYAVAVATVLGLCVGRLAGANSTQCRWNVARSSPKIEPAFGRHDLPMTWDFAESNPFGGSVGDWDQVVQTVLRGVAYAPSQRGGAARLSDARTVAPIEPARPVLVATDPPYFGHIDYSELSDYFYIWLRRALRTVHPDLFSLIVPPRAAELVALPSRHNGSARAAYDYFVSGFTEVFRLLTAKQDPSYPMLVVYAHRESDGAADATGGWEAMLEAVLAAGLSIVGTLPIQGTRGQRMTSIGTNALATYVVMVCRPRAPDASRITRTTFARLLRETLSESVAELQHANIAPVDLAQAVIGPGMQVYSRHAQVMETDGSRVGVAAALAVINRTLAEVLNEQEGDLDPQSRWAVTWYDDHGFGAAPFGMADQLARAKGIAVDSLVQAGIVTSGAGKVALIARDNLSRRWDPSTDRRATAWEAVQYLVRSLSEGGERAASELYARLGVLADPARELAYRLFQIAETEDRIDEAIAYNGLMTSWSEIARLADDLVRRPASRGIETEALF